MVRKIKDRVTARHRVPLSEVGGQNTWQRIVLGFALVGSDRAAVEGRLAELVGFIAQVADAEPVADEREILSYGDEPIGDAGNQAALLAKISAEAEAEAEAEAASDPMDASWIPDSWKSEEFS